MTVVQLIAALQKCPQDDKVYKDSDDYHIIDNLLNIG
jgi:hypothetical protein